MKRYTQLKRHGDHNKAVRNEVKERDSHTCLFCTKQGTDVHHVIHRSQGGKDVPANMVYLCREHHEAIHAENPDHSNSMFMTCVEYLADFYTTEHTIWIDGEVYNTDWMNSTD